MPKKLTYYSLLFCALALNSSMILSQELSVKSIPSNCFAQNSGQVKINFPQKNSPFIYILSSDSLHKIELKRSPLTKEVQYTFTAIPPGKYYVTAIGADGKPVFKTVIIEQPAQLLPGKIKIQSYPSSSSARNGIVEAFPNGGTPPYSYSWQGNAVNGKESKISSLATGIYKCNIIDSHGCGPVSATIVLGTKPITKKTGLSMTVGSFPDKIILILLNQFIS